MVAAYEILHTESIYANLNPVLLMASIDTSLYFYILKANASLNETLYPFTKYVEGLYNILIGRNRQSDFVDMLR